MTTLTTLAQAAGEPRIRMSFLPHLIIFISGVAFFIFDLDTIVTSLDAIKELQARMGTSLIGQQQVIDSLILGLFANGNLLLAGRLPGLDKTRVMKSIVNNLVTDGPVPDQPAAKLANFSSEHVAELQEAVSYRIRKHHPPSQG